MDFRLEVLSLLGEYPLLVPTNGYRKWEGYISVNNSQFKTSIVVPNYPSLDGILWELPPSIQKQLLISEDSISKCQSLHEFLKTLEVLILRSIENNTLTADVCVGWNEKNISTYKQLVIDIDRSLNSCFIEEIGQDFKWIKVGYKDSDCSTHSITLNLKFCEQKADFEIVSHELPTDAISILSEITSLHQLFSKFEEVIESLIPFWNVCKEIGKKTWVMDPSNPKKKDIYRRIYLAENLSITLKFNPFDIVTFPEIKFLGSINAVNMAREKFQNCLEIHDGWDSDLTILENLERLLEINKFPIKNEVEYERHALGKSSDCLICYIILTEEEPVKYCLNEKCSALFHLTCLLKWFETSQISIAGPNHDYFRGPCPCCENLLYCPRNYEP